MSIIQKNMFGHNVIYVVPQPMTRNLTPEIKTELLSIIKDLGASSAVIRYEQGGETAEFSNIVAHFLGENNIKVNMVNVMMSEIQRNEFSIQKHPSDPDYVIIKIGPVY
jgi:hypothetical protein